MRIPVQRLAHRAFMELDAPALADEAAQVYPTPAHHLIHGRIRKCLNGHRQLGNLLGFEEKCGSRRDLIGQACQPFRVVAGDPVPRGLPVHVAALGYLLAALGSSASIRLPAPRRCPPQISYCLLGARDLHRSACRHNPLPPCSRTKD